MMLALFVLMIGVAAWYISEWMWRGSVLSRFEKASAAALVGISLILIASWTLALIGHLRSRWLLVAAALFAAVGLLLSRMAASQVGPAPPVVSAETDDRETDSASRDYRLLRLTAGFVVLLPLFCWTSFLLWKGYVAPPLSHDALVYHLPRAALIAKAGGYEKFDYPDGRINSLPANYELLLADILLLAGGDEITEWLSTLLFVLFLIQAAALSRRWWGPGIHSLAVAIVISSTPLYLLHGAAHKNDLLVAWFVVGAMLWGGRWLTHREIPAAALTLAAICGAAGTKPQGLIVGGFVGVVLIWGAARGLKQGMLRSRQIIGLLIFLAFTFPFLGGSHYLILLNPEDSAPPSSLTGAAKAVTATGYGEWSYLWKTPVMTLLAPFSPSARDVTPPWSEFAWFWPRYDLHDSNYGRVISILVLTIPLCMWRYRRTTESDQALERRVTLLVGLAIAMVILPARDLIYGHVSAYPRYLMYLPALIAAATIAPLFRELEYGGRAKKIAAGVVVTTLAAIFINTAFEFAERDHFGPLRQIIWAAERPGVRYVPGMAYRSTVLADLAAGPRDVIDVYSKTDTWIYPLMGPAVERDLHFIDSIEEIRPEAQWVVVDQKYFVTWSGLGDTEDWGRELGAQPPRKEDLDFIRKLRAGSEFEAIYIHEDLAQAIFRRRVPSRNPPPG